MASITSPARPYRPTAGSPGLHIESASVGATGNDPAIGARVVVPDGSWHHSAMATV